MKVIITGGGGFLGSQLCQKLLERGKLTGPCGTAETIREIVLLDAAVHRPATDPRVRQHGGFWGEWACGLTRKFLASNVLVRLVATARVAIATADNGEGEARESPCHPMLCCSVAPPPTAQIRI
jgi:uncharacterized protein YbjT (DUF2867 family)